MMKLCHIVCNPDIMPHIELLVECMENPNRVTTAVQTISATTFVAEVTGPALAIMVPLLVRALNDRSAAVLRPTTIIADNLFKLVRNPADAGQFMPQLLPGLDRIIETAAFPEIRDLASAAKNTLTQAAGGSTDLNERAVLISKEDVKTKISEFLSLKKVFLVSFFKPWVDYAAEIMFHLSLKENFKIGIWKELLLPIVRPLITPYEDEMVEYLYNHFHDVYRKSQSYGDICDEVGELLCDCEFSLAYGGMMLLNNTLLRLHRGQRYGLCGHNGCVILNLNTGQIYFDAIYLCREGRRIPEPR